MFSGLVSYSGRVLRVETLESGGVRLRVRCENASEEGIEVKDSVAVNGVCLTAVQIKHDRVDFDVVPETLERSNLGTLREGEIVNVEYSLRLGDRLGGHFVYGHVDATGEVRARVPEGQGARMRIELPTQLRPYLCEKAFVSVDGVSVTVASVDEDAFELALIPETLRRTTLGRRNPGERVNVEIDPIARYAIAAVQALGGS